MQGKIYKIVKILGRMNSRTVMMERFQDAEFSWHALLSTEDSNDSQKRMRAVLTIHPTLAYPFFSLIRPLFLRVLPKGGWICEGLLYMHLLPYLHQQSSTLYQLASFITNMRQETFWYIPLILACNKRHRTSVISVADSECLQKHWLNSKWQKLRPSQYLQKLNSPPVPTITHLTSNSSITVLRQRSYGWHEINLHKTLQQLLVLI